MTIIFEIKEGTKEYESAERAFTWKDAWQTDEVLLEFTTAIGIDPTKNMQMNPYVLRLYNLPDGVRDQFKKSRTSSGHYEAFAKSDINQRYLAIIKKRNLTTYSMTEFSLQFGWDVVDSLHLVITGSPKVRRFFIGLKDNVTVNSLQKLKNHSALVFIKESEYLTLRANQLQENGK